MKTSTFPRMHVSLYVSDLASTVDFYTLFFGIEPVKVRTGYAKYVLEEPPLIISFVENKERVQQNFGHLGFQVEALAELNSRLAAAERTGLVTKVEIGTNCCFANQDKFWVSDPDGVQWEVYYFHADAEFNDPHFEEPAAACCIAPAPEKKKVVEFKNLVTEAACCTAGSGCC
jgi:catechol 2,3-dioxygenase-like lactoylglutathione lyase family enzyme